MTSSDLICTDCLHGKHSHHNERWGGICIGCACAYQPLPDAAEGTGETDSHDDPGQAYEPLGPTSDAVRDLAAPSDGENSSRPSPGADPRIEAVVTEWDHRAGYELHPLERHVRAFLAAADAADKAVNELYHFRLLYNAALFNEWAAQGKYLVHKSWHHADDPGAPIFGGGWFIVMAELPSGQISNHYEAQHWDLFRVVEVPVADAWDGHTASDVADRLLAALREAGEQ